ncbi:restriction endonuclease subunit S [Thermodesulfobacteriota bacterium]
MTPSSQTMEPPSNPGQFNVVIATRVGLGKICLVNQDTAINQDLRGIVPLSTDVLNVRYLFWWLKSIAHLIEKEGTGATVKGVKLPFVKSLRIPLPPLPKQKRIVAILDEAFVGITQTIANAEKNLANARELFESYLNNVFAQKGEGWVDAPIEDHIKFIDYRGRTPKKIDAGMRLITAKNVKMGFLQLEPQEFVEPNIYEEWMTRGIPKKGDVLFTTEAPLGNVAQLDTDEKVLFAQRVIIMQPNRDVLKPTFLKYMLMSRTLQSRLHEKATGATAKGIKASLLKKVSILFPQDTAIQKAIVSQLETLGIETQNLETIYQKKLTALVELKQSILQKTFKGELTADVVSRQVVN